MQQYDLAWFYLFGYPLGHQFRGWSSFVVSTDAPDYDFIAGTAHRPHQSVIHYTPRRPEEVITLAGKVFGYIGSRFQFPFDLPVVQGLEIRGMSKGMIANNMPTVGYLFYYARVFLHAFPNHEKGSLGVILVKDVQNLCCIYRHGPVIKGKRYHLFLDGVVIDGSGIGHYNPGIES